MRRLLSWLAGSALLAAAVLVGVQVAAPTVDTSPTARAERLSGQLRCPDCQALSVAESRTNAAAAIRAEVAAQVAAGRSDDEVRQHFVERYGQWILLAPRDPLVWWLPAAVFAVAALGFGAWMLSGRRARQLGADQDRAADSGSDEAELRRVREELEALDG